MNSFRKKIQNRLSFSLFTLTKLPLAWVAGLRVTDITDERATVSCKLNYWTKNPFKSMYFAAQAMAAELSTGVLVMDQVYQQKNKKISMLVLEMNAGFTKKAVGNIRFTCNDGNQLKEIIEKVVSQPEGQTITLTSEGVDESGAIVSKFSFIWTVKEKK